VAHPTEAELRQLANEILDLLVTKTIEEYDSFMRAQENWAQQEYGGMDNLPNTGPDPDQRRADVEAYVREAYGFLPDTYAKFAEPRPEEFDPLIAQCATTLMLLQPNMETLTEQGRIYSAAGDSASVAADFPTTISERVTDVQGQVVEWEGTAANAFNQHYLNQFPDSIRLQHDAVFGLAAAMEANKKIFENVGQDILQIGAKTKDALTHITDKNPTGEVIFLTVAAAVVAVAGAATGVGAGAGLAAATIILASVAAAGSAASDIIGATAPEPHKSEIEGATTQEIMVSMVDRISDLYRFIDEQENKIVTALNGANEFLEKMRAEIELPVPDPYLNLGNAPPGQIDDVFVHP
jgi:hypothetical protein